ncbi:DNA-binding LacI/PurR family transcriptional regulator [Janthinobacterium sp. 13]|nr:DNA-binding LacI/PurR family transcriptional regulator [Janthinobacterium sp. 13]
MEQKDKSWVTSVDVAKRAGVSRSAVSRTFTPGASVAPETRARVMEAAQSLGYQVNILARSMNQGQSNLVGVVITGFTDPFRVALLGEVTRSLSEHALVPLLMNAEDPERLSELLRILLSYKISGVIMTSGSPPSAVATEYLQRQVPVAMINRARDLKGVDVVNSDNRHGGELAASTLLDSGAKRLTFINTRASSFSGIARGQAFLDHLAPAVAKKRCTAGEYLADAIGYQAGQEAADALLASGKLPDGVFCATDLIACGFIDAARSKYGINVPAQLQVIGFDDIPMAALDAYQLTTIRQDAGELARRAVKSLVERMEKFAMPGRLKEVPVTLVRRGTTR